MSPEDMNPEWVEKAAATLRDSSLINVCGDDRGCQCEEAVEYSQAAAHDMLAAVLPEAMAEAWVEGRDDGLDDLGATQTAIDYGELTNPYEEGSGGEG